jgi:hypothetical protein
MFGGHSPRRARFRRTLANAAALGMVLAIVSRPLAAPSSTHQLPNLVLLDPIGVVVELADHSSTQRALRFWTRVTNTGSFPLDLQGKPEDIERAGLSQCVQWEGTLCSMRGQYHPGRFSYKVGDRCWLLRNLARYELRVLRPDGSIGDVAATSYAPHPISDVSAGALTLSCTFAAQGLSVGRSIFYDADTDGQQIPIDGVADGRYLLTQTLDPDGFLVEEQKNDNSASLAIEIFDGGRQARPIE